MAALVSVFPFSPSSMLAPLTNSIWLDDQIGSYRSKPISSGYRKLDEQLPSGGWPLSVVTELLLTNPGVGELRLLASTLTHIVQAGKTVVVLAPAHLAIATALNGLGINMNNITIIEADKPTDKIRAVEQALKSASFGALLCWLPHARDDHLRRLQLAAAGTQGLTFLFRPLDAQEQASPAPLRMLCKPLAIGRFSIEIIKRRGPVRVEPIILPLEIPEILLKPLANRVLGTPVFSTSTYAVDRSALAATAARHRRALQS